MSCRVRAPSPVRHPARKHASKHANKHAVGEAAPPGAKGDTQRCNAQKM